MRFKVEKYGALSVGRFPLGPYQTNCYLLWHGQSGMVIDASYEPRAMIEAIGELSQAGVVFTEIVLTHGHCDHIAGLDFVRDACGRQGAGGSGKTRVSIHKLEEQWLGNPMLNLSAAGGEIVVVNPADELLVGRERKMVGEVELELRPVPGHTPGSVALVYHEGKVVFGGDALFAGSIGRTDFPEGSLEVLRRSITQELYTLGDEYVVLSGHGPPTTIGAEKAHNPFVRG